MTLKALRLAAAASLMATAAMAQTQSNTTSTSTTVTTANGRGPSVTTNGTPANAPNAAPQTMAPGQVPAPDATQGAEAAPTSGGAFQPLPQTSSQDIVSTLQQSGQFSTFLKIADATSLTQVLKTQPNITVFAPTNAAFAAMPAASMDLKDQATLQKLQKLLTYHIVATTVPPLAGHSGASVATAAGTKVYLDGSGPNVKINDATALQKQVTAANGVIYPIDKVLSPDFTPPPAATTTTTDQSTDTKTTTTTKKKSSRRRHSS